MTKKKKTRVLVNTNYGPVKEGKTYELVEIGRDHKVLRARGKLVYVPNYVFLPPIKPAIADDEDKGEW